VFEPENTAKHRTTPQNTANDRYIATPKKKEELLLELLLVLPTSSILDGEFNIGTV
jgi:hypothetical protein